MKKLLLAGGILVALLAIYFLWKPSPSPSATLYVASTGDDTARGSKNAPLRTFEEAIAQAQPGTTIIIRGGTYTEPLSITKSELQIQAYEGEKVRLNGRELKSMDGNRAMVTIHNQHDITLDGLTIENVTTKSANDTVMGIYVSGNSHHITLKNNHIRKITTRAVDGEGNGHGIAFYGTGAMKHIQITHNTLEDLILGSSEALVLNGNIEDFSITDNTIRRSDNIGIDVIGYEGVAIKKEADYVRNGTIKNNTISQVSSYGNPAYGEDYSAGGIYVDGAKNITIEGNNISFSDIGIEATSEHAGKYADEIIIKNNKVRNNYYTGISIGGYDAQRGGTKNSVIEKNKLAHNDTEGLDGGQLLIQYNTKDNRIAENDFIASESTIYIANFFTQNYRTIVVDNYFDSEKGLWFWKDNTYESKAAFEQAVNH